MASVDISVKDHFSKGSKGLNVPRDEIDEVLSEMIAGTAMSPADPKEEQIKFFKPCVIKDKHHNQKISQIEGVFTDLSNTSRWRNEPIDEGSRKRVARSVSPQATPSQKNRRLSEGSERVALGPGRRIFKEPSQRSISEMEENAAVTNTDSPVAERAPMALVVPSKKRGPKKNEEPAETAAAKKELSGRRRKCASSNSEESDITKPKRAKQSLKSEEAKMGKRNTRQKSTSDALESSLSTSPANLKKPNKKEKNELFKVELTGNNEDSKICSSSIVIKLKRCNMSTEAPDKKMGKLDTPESGANISLESSHSKNGIEKPEPSPETSKKVTKASKRTAKANKLGSKKEASLSIDEKTHDIPKSKRIEAQKPVIQKRITRLNSATESLESLASKDHLEAPSTASKTSSERELEDVPKNRSRARTKAIVVELHDITKTKKAKESSKAEQPKIQKRVTRLNSANESVESHSKTPSTLEATVRNKSSSEHAAKGRSGSTKLRTRKGSALPGSNEEELLDAKKTKRDKASVKPEEPMPEKRNNRQKSTNESLEASCSQAHKEISSTSAGAVKKPGSKDEEVSAKNHPRATSRRLSMTPPSSLKAITQYVKNVRGSGKIKITLSMCNRNSLESVLKSLKSESLRVLSPSETITLPISRGH
ncbi:hypothetical protein KR067_009602 [Drosophila pandora]|nr:hypothetical protein KR067_009602 [Drosophila pandora]